MKGWLAVWGYSEDFPSFCAAVKRQECSHSCQQDPQGSKHDKSD